MYDDENAIGRVSHSFAKRFTSKEAILLVKGCELRITFHNPEDRLTLSVSYWGKKMRKLNRGKAEYYRGGKKRK